jgi:hypothetical protein
MTGRERTPPCTPKQRMLNAYRGLWSDRIPVAPEFWYYYPAKVLGVDMIRFSREVPFYQALKTTFERFGCEGWGCTSAGIPNDRVQWSGRETWLDDNTLETRSTCATPAGEVSYGQRFTRDEPSWGIERPIKDLARDLPAWEHIAFGGEPEAMDLKGAVAAWNEVGESYLLELYIGVPFFDFLAGALQGGFEQGIYLFSDPEAEPLLRRLQDRYTERLVRTARVACERSTFESLFIGCTWSCNSLLGPDLWRRWDKPVLDTVCREVHRCGRLLHAHVHGRCFDTVADLAEIGFDCVCPFERPPGGDVVGLEGLRAVERLLRGRTAMNGNVHTVETLIRGTPAAVRREVDQILEAFRDNPRVIVGTGDQVGRETPEENLYAMIEEARR